MQQTFCGLNRSELNQVLNTVIVMKEKMIDITEEEQEAWNTAIMCVCQILVRMTDNKPIRWD